MIGAVDLSEKEKALERAAREGDIAYIHENHANVLETYRELIKKIHEKILVPRKNLKKK